MLSYLTSNMASWSFSLSLAHVWLCFLLLPSAVLQSPKLRDDLSTTPSTCFLTLCWFSASVFRGRAASSDSAVPRRRCASARDSSSDATIFQASLRPPRPSRHARDSLRLNFDRLLAYCSSASDLKSAYLNTWQETFYYVISLVWN